MFFSFCHKIVHSIQPRSPRIVQNARNILIFWLIHPKIPQQQQLQNGEKWKSNLKRTMFRLMVKLIHPQRAADCTAADCHQKQRLFWDSPLPPFGFFLSAPIIPNSSRLASPSQRSNNHFPISPAGTAASGLPEGIERWSVPSLHSA